MVLVISATEPFIIGSSVIVGNRRRKRRAGPMRINRPNRSTCRDTRTQSLEQINNEEDAPGCSGIHGSRKTGENDVTLSLATSPRWLFGRKEVGAGRRGEEEGRPVGGGVSGRG